MRPKVLLALFLLLSALSAAGFYVEEMRLEQREQTIQALTQEVAVLQQKVSGLEYEVKNLTEQLTSREEALLQSKNRIAQLEEENLELRRVSRVRFAVVGVDETGRGSVIPMYVSVTSGSGRVFLDVSNIVFDESLQSSAQTAVLVARYYTRVDMRDKDVKIVLKPETTDRVYTIGGGSGGAAMAIAVIAALKGVNLSDDVLITGTIKPDGRIGRISGQKAKALAVREHGARMFLVPSGQKVSINGIKVREVRNIEQALQYVLPGI